MRITSYRPEAVEISVAAGAPGLLILADQAFPGWAARVDGEPTPIITVDHALRGVYILAGTHQVSFSYEPWPFRLGAALTLGSLLLLCLLLARLGRRARRRLGNGR